MDKNLEKGFIQYEQKYLKELEQVKEYIMNKMEQSQSNNEQIKVDFTGIADEPTALLAIEDLGYEYAISEGEKEGVKFDEEEYKKSESLIKLQLKALIARDLWNMNEYYHTINVVNESVNKALELLK